MEKTEINNPVDGVLRHRDLDRLFLNGRLDVTCHGEALRFAAGRQPWLHWVDGFSLLLGASLLLAGLVFFFAFNWARIPGWGKLALVELLLVSTLVVSWRKGRETLVGRVLLLAASTLVGIFLAVFGQVYQTGADAWTLFALWSLLIVPWVVLSRFPGLMVFWVILIHTALILYWAQTRAAGETWLLLLLTLLDAAFLVTRELLDQLGYDWISPLWPRRLLLAAALLWPSSSTIGLILGEQRLGLASLLGVLALVGVSLGGLVYYRRIRGDMGALALIVLALDAVLLFLIGRLSFEVSGEAGTFLFMTLAIMGVFALSGHWLLQQRKTLREVKGE